MKAFIILFAIAGLAGAMAETLPVSIEKAITAANDFGTANKTGVKFTRQGSDDKAVRYMVGDAETILVSFSSTDGKTASDLIMAVNREGTVGNAQLTMLATVALVISVDPELGREHAAKVVIDLIEGSAGGKKKEVIGKACKFTASTETPGIFGITMGPK